MLLVFLWLHRKGIFDYQKIQGIAIFCLQISFVGNGKSKKNSTQKRRGVDIRTCVNKRKGSGVDQVIFKEQTHVQIRLGVYRAFISKKKWVENSQSLNVLEIEKWAPKKRSLLVLNVTIFWKWWNFQNYPEVLHQEIDSKMPELSGQSSQSTEAINEFLPLAKA